MFPFLPAKMKNQASLISPMLAIGHSTDKVHIPPPKDNYCFFLLCIFLLDLASFLCTISSTRLRCFLAQPDVDFPFRNACFPAPPIVPSV
mmetsp:Transcript_3608/g.5607  ORF Transcript_3608/g.5607 Transcript_3608/m.5607 type:complete len:90 (+) Transcript_3608:225-494(+)